MAPISVRALLICVVLVLPVLAFAAPADLQDEIHEALRHRQELAANKVRLMEKSARMEATKTANQELYDVHHYFLDLTLDPDQQVLTGEVSVSAEVTGASIATMDLNLNAGMNLIGVTIGGVPVGTSRAGTS